MSSDFRRIPVLIALGLVPGSAWAFDIDPWRPGAGSAHTGDAITAPSAWSLGEEQTSFRLGYNLGSGLLYASTNPDGSESDFQALFGTVGTLAVVGERGLAENWSVGGRIRGVAHAAEVDGGAPIGVQQLGFQLPTDVAVWSHHSRSLGERLRIAVGPELRFDPRTRQGESPELPTLRSISGTGTGVGVPVSVGWTPAGPDGPWRVLAAVSPGIALDDPNAVPTTARLATDAWVATSYQVSDRLAVVGEGAYHLAMHGQEEQPFLAHTPVLRAGGRLTPSPSWSILGTLTTSAGSIGAGATPLGAGIELQWRQRPAGTVEKPDVAGPGEVVIAAVDAEGRPVSTPAPAPNARPGPDGSWIVPVDPLQPLTAGGGDWITRTQVVPLDGPGPWSWQPVLVPRAGDAAVRMQALDVADAPVALDAVTFSGVDLGPLPAGTVLTIDGLVPGPVPFTVTGPFETEILLPSVADVDPDIDPLVVGVATGSTAVAVTGPDGPVADARLVARSAFEEREIPLDPTGAAESVLPAGSWLLRAEAPGFGGQEATLEVEDGQRTLERITFDLLPAVEDGADLVVSVFDADGVVVSGADVQVGGVTVARTASGGRIRVEDLAPGSADLAVVAERYRDVAPARLALSADAATEVEVPLLSDSGAVRVRVKSATGELLPEANVRFVGEEVLPLLSPGPDGLVETILAVGVWEAVVSAPGHTIQAVDLEVRPDQERHLEVDVTLQKPAPEPGRLAVRVVDDKDSPLVGAYVRLGEMELGRTGNTGTLRVDGLEAGAVDLTVEASLHDPWSGEARIVPDEAPEAQTVALRASAGLLSVEAVGPDGPINAWARFVGPIVPPGVLLGSKGSRRFALPPGSWEVVLSDPAHGISVHDVVLAPAEGANVRWDAERSEFVQAILAPERVPVEITVIDTANDAPIAARVRLVGPEVLEPVSTTPTENVKVELVPGEWEAVASSPEHGIGGADVQVVRTPPPPVSIELGARRATVTTEAVEISETIEFALDSARLAPTSQDLLREISRTLQLHPELLRIRIEGHTDDTGDAARNDVLSRERALAVRDWLVEHGVAASRLETEGYGASQPIADNATEAGRARNRRVAFRITEQAE